jgi:CheY-like chemotaxis protein
MPSGGQLTIKTANVDLDEDHTRERSGLQPGPHVMMAVIDTGIGMDKELQARIFEPFFTTKEVGRGTGLGLATVYGIVTQSGGDIRVYSEPGRGSTFKVYLPRLKEEVSTSGPAPVATLSARGTETILIVEDETVLRKLAVAALADNGYTILQTGKPNEALQLAKEYQGNIALLLTDVVLPQMRGPQLAEQIVQLRPEIRVLYMSGYTEDAIMTHRGVSKIRGALLQKPFTPEDLMSSVREALDAPVPI